MFRLTAQTTFKFRFYWPILRLIHQWPACVPHQGTLMEKHFHDMTFSCLAKLLCLLLIFTNIHASGVCYQLTSRIRIYFYFSSFMGPRYINHMRASYFTTRYTSTNPGEFITFQRLHTIEDVGGDIVGWGVLIFVIAYKLQQIEIRCTILTYRIVP